MGFIVDLHVHTRHSGDNDAVPEEIVERAIERGLHGIAFTEHNSFGASEFALGLRERYSGSIRIFRGVEISALEGHCLVFGLDTDPLELNGRPAPEVVRAVNENGGVAIPSHPYRPWSGVGRHIRGLDGICALEGYNGNIMHSLNALAVAESALLGIPYIGGSDAHSPESVGRCYTDFVDEVTEDNLIDMLRNGRYTGVDVRGLRRHTLLTLLLRAFHRVY